jgi:hypothetical protein
MRPAGRGAKGADVARARRRSMREQGMFDARPNGVRRQTRPPPQWYRFEAAAPAGIRLIDHVPHWHWKTITLHNQPAPSRNGRALRAVDP